MNKSAYRKWYSGRSVYLFILFAFCLNSVDVAHAAPSFGHQSSTKNVEWDFDFVETFDGLQNWVRNEGSVGNVHDVNKMPKLENGSNSAWGYYSIWGDGAPTQNWIGAYGDNRVWRGTKSLAIDIGETQKGPSRFGLFMGEGYKEFYLFFMVNIPKNEWPTDAGAGVYEAGKPYDWFSSWKFTTFNMGCPSALCPDKNTYSEYYHIIAHLKQYNYGAAPGITPLISSYAYNDNKWALDGGKNLNNLAGDWFGIEYQVTQTATQTIFSVWVYDKNGNATKMMESKAWATPAVAQGKLWNQLFFGGNNSGTYNWGPTMESAYYIDDVIIDDKRIGPKYFTIINSASSTGAPSIAAPLPPSNLEVKTLSQ